MYTQKRGIEQSTHPQTRNSNENTHPKQQLSF